MAGHLFGYEAALVIDVSAHPCARHARRCKKPPSRDDLLDALGNGARRTGAACSSTRCASATTTATSTASTAVRIASLFRYALGDRAARPLRGRPRQGRHADGSSSKTSRSRSRSGSTSSRAPSTPSSTRPRRSPSASRVPTKSCSRSRSCARCSPPARSRDSLSYRSLRTLVALDPAVVQVVGYTRYRVEGDLAADAATMHVVDTSVDFASRTATDPTLRGTKHRVAHATRGHRGARPQRRSHARDRAPRSRATRPWASPCCTSSSPTDSRAR